MRTAVVFLLGLAVANAKVYFRENFDDGEGWKKRWVVSEHKDDLGKMELSAGKYYGDQEKDVGLQTSQDAKFYAVSAKFDSFSNEGKDLVVQFTVKHEQTIDCGGGYLKLFKQLDDQKDLHGETPYNIMFGPDICGPSNQKVHVIFSHKGENYLTEKRISPKTDDFTHIYTLIVKPDNTYSVLIDNEKVESGTLEEDWKMVPPKLIKDPEAKKPEDWVDNEKMDDPDDVKPDDWDVPEYIPDPDATKPEDWDDDMDGEWEPPQIDNPEYKGEWKPKQIDNPDYKGQWVHPEIDNPDYAPNPNLYKYDFGAIGLDLWQVKSGTIFDNFLICDDVDLAKTEAEAILERTKKEHEMADAIREKEKEEEAMKKKPEDDEDDEDEDIEDDEDDDTSEDASEDTSEDASEDAKDHDEL